MNTPPEWIEWDIPVYLLEESDKREYIKFIMQKINMLVSNKQILDVRRSPSDEYGRNIKYAFLIDPNHKESIENSLTLVGAMVSDRPEVIAMTYEQGYRDARANKPPRVGGVRSICGDTSGDGSI